MFFQQLISLIFIHSYVNEEVALLLFSTHSSKSFIHTYLLTFKLEVPRYCKKVARYVYSFQVNEMIIAKTSQGYVKLGRVASVPMNSNKVGPARLIGCFCHLHYDYFLSNGCFLPLFSVLQSDCSDLSCFFDVSEWVSTSLDSSFIGIHLLMRFYYSLFDLHLVEFYSSRCVSSVK